MKWYEERSSEKDVIVASRIRLLRNLTDYVYPWKLKEEESEKLIAKLRDGMADLTSMDGRVYQFCKLDQLTEAQRMAFRERRVISQAAAQSSGAGLLLSEDESVSILMNCEDHLRIQINKAGAQLSQAWKEIDRIDDYINARYPYAFDEHVGYLTTYPTNIGTGMRAYMVLHLALFDSVSKFQDIIGEIGRYGLKLKPAFASDRQQNGNMYLLYNEKTLGISEEEILELLEKVAGQLTAQERMLRENSVEKHHLEVEDICYKAYGTIRYSRLLTLKMAMHLLSQLRWGQEMDVIHFQKPCNFYELMMEIQQANLAVTCSKPMQADAQNEVRAKWIREKLPELQ